MPAAIAIPAIIGAAGVGTSIAGAKIAANASRDAARQQQDATNRAQAFNQQIYQDQQKLMNPYTQAGQYALSNLMARQYGGSPNQFAPTPGYGAPMGQAPAQGYSPMLGNMGGAPPPQVPQGPPQVPQGDLVTLQGPDGSTKQVPRAMAPLYLQRGARMVN